MDGAETPSASNATAGQVAGGAVTVVIPALNEAEHIEACIRDGRYAPAGN